VPDTAAFHLRCSTEIGLQVGSKTGGLTGALCVEPLSDSGDNAKLISDDGREAITDETGMLEVEEKFSLTS
jgi:hypothetical protein